MLLNGCFEGPPMYLRTVDVLRTEFPKASLNAQPERLDVIVGVDSFLFNAVSHSRLNISYSSIHI
jgi:hypothetical protein